MDNAFTYNYFASSAKVELSVYTFIQILKPFFRLNKIIQEQNKRYFIGTISINSLFWYLMTKLVEADVVSTTEHEFSFGEATLKPFFLIDVLAD